MYIHKMYLPKSGCYQTIKYPIDPTGDLGGSKGLDVICRGYIM